MYTPKHFQAQNDEKILEFIQKYSFAILIGVEEGKPLASHIPLELIKKENGKQYLQGHVAKANPVWRSFQENQLLLAIFSEPHAYISPTWYEEENVPTWNYVAVHVYGYPRILEGEELKTCLANLVNRNEVALGTDLRFENMSEKMIQNSSRGLVAFEIEIQDIQAAYKLSQNRSERDYDNIISELEKQESENSQTIAEEMKNLKKTN